MKRITVSIDDDLAVIAQREAHRRRVSVSAVVRDALTAQLGVMPGRPRQLPFAALGDSGHRSTARDFEEILAAERARDRGR
jgi:Arc/MetJ-type ribon-helix-helix transcriptional regulator